MHFEVHMYHSIGRANTLTPVNWFCSLYCHTHIAQNQRDFPSRLKFSFLLDSDIY